MTSKVDMMRPNSAKSPLRMSSQLAASAAPQANRDRTPTHHKAATVTGTDVTDGRSSRTPFVLASVPSEGERGRRGASFGSQPVRDTSRAPEHGRTLQSSLKVSPDHGHSHSQLATDFDTPSMAITAPEPKPSREAKTRTVEETAPLTPTTGSAETRQSKEPRAKENDSLSATTTTEPKPGKEAKPGKDFKLGKELKLGKEVKAKETDPRSRKSSEPPLSLQALFDPEIHFSRHMNKQTSADEVVHLKQSSYDGSRAHTPQGSPKHMRRMRSPAMPLIGGEMQRTPSHPHLSSAASSPHVVYTNLATSLPSGPLLRARSTQQIKAETDAEELSLKRRSYSGEGAGKADMQNMSVLVQQGAVLKTEVDVAVKDSLSTNNVPSPESQRAKVPVKDTSTPRTRDGKVPVTEISTPGARGVTAAGSSVAKEGRERSTSAPKDPQAVLETEDIVEPLQVGGHCLESSTYVCAISGYRPLGSAAAEFPV